MDDSRRMKKLHMNNSPSITINNNYNNQVFLIQISNKCFRS